MTADLDETFLQRLEAYGPVPRTLSWTVRPAFVAPEGKTLVWGDWSAIEARVLPWLADSRGSRAVLDVFSGNDNDPGKPDIYMIEYANLTDEDAQAVWDRYRDGDKTAKKGRQQGKVSVLSLGFGGFIGALMRMAVNYGVYYDEETARRVATVWREANPWARHYWDRLWEATLGAYEHPDTIYEAGRNAYVYDKTYMGGTLFAAQPNGALLSYPNLRWRVVEDEDPETGKVIEKKVLSFRKGYGWSGLWFGKCAENNTQATAAQLLRAKMVEQRPWKTAVGHTHDELVHEVDEADVEDFSKRLRASMVTNPAWMGGCPLAAEITSNWYYTKALD